MIKTNENYIKVKEALVRDYWHVPDFIKYIKSFVKDGL